MTKSSYNSILKAKILLLSRWLLGGDESQHNIRYIRELYEQLSTRIITITIIIIIIRGPILQLKPDHWKDCSFFFANPHVYYVYIVCNLWCIGSISRVCNRTIVNMYSSLYRSFFILHRFNVYCILVVFLGLTDVFGGIVKVNICVNRSYNTQF